MGDQRNSKSQATLLVELASQDSEFFHKSDETAYATIMVKTHRETWPLQSRGFREWMIGRFYEKEKKAPRGQAITEAIGTLEAKARHGGHRYRVFTRIGKRNGRIYLDLGDSKWKAVRISAEGWDVVSKPLVRFWRPRGMSRLPTPVSDGSINDLRPFLNVRSNADWILIVSWLIGAFRPGGPFPLLVLSGEQGAAKSTAARILRALIDPNAVPLRGEPQNVRDLMIAAKHSYVQAYDNLSRMPELISDALCQLSTGGGFATRQLYTDADEILFKGKRPCILNGIEAVATRADLLDRSLIIDLPAIPKERRRPEKTLWQEFEEARPSILGALLDAIVAALRNVKKVQLKNPPRMADFAQWVAAAEPGLGWPPETFLAAYERNRSSANTLALNASPIAPEILKFFKKTAVWKGTATDLLRALNLRNPGIVLQRQRGWPSSPKALSSVLKRYAPNLRAEGVDVSFSRKAHTGERLITMRKTGKK